MKRIILLCLGTLLLSSCQARISGPELELSAPKLVIGTGHGSGHKSGFCPPGQAKKGRC